MGGLGALAARQAVVSAPLTPVASGVLGLVPSLWRLLIVTAASLLVTLAILPAFEAKGIRLFLCKTSVNPGFDPQRTFVWIEFSARPGYEPAEQYVAPPKEGSNAQCVIM